MKSGDIGLLVLQLAKLDIDYKRFEAIYRANPPDILTYIDQKYWSDLEFIGLYGKLVAPGSF